MLAKRIKNTKIDEAARRVIRERDNWTCQASGLVDPDGQVRKVSSTVEWCHIYGRRTVSMRWHPTNTITLSKHKHRYFTENPLEFKAFIKSYLGDQRYWALIGRFNRTDIKYTNKDRQLIYAHLCNEFERLCELRAEGRGGVLTVEAYD